MVRFWYTSLISSAKYLPFISLSLFKKIDLISVFPRGLYLARNLSKRLNTFTALTSSESSVKFSNEIPSPAKHSPNVIFWSFSMRTTSWSRWEEYSSNVQLNRIFLECSEINSSLFLIHKLLLISEHSKKILGAYIRRKFDLLFHKLQEVNSSWCRSHMNVRVYFDNLIEIYLGILQPHYPTRIIVPSCTPSPNSRSTVRIESSKDNHERRYNLKVSSNPLSRWMEKEIVGPWEEIFSRSLKSFTKSE